LATVTWLSIVFPKCNQHIFRRRKLEAVKTHAASLSLLPLKLFHPSERLQCLRDILLWPYNFL
jgi:hypothetical protein